MIRRCNQIIVCALLLAPLTAVPDYSAQAATRDVMAQAATAAANAAQQASPAPPKAPPLKE